MKRTIIHIDMDAFFASVEERDNPELKGKPLVIGALPDERGVVSTCNYEARKFGIHSAMNIKEAYRRCPDAVFMHGDMKKYEQVSLQIHQIMLKFTDKIEFVALDEGYMDVTSSLRLFGGAENIGRQLKKEIFETLGLTCSVGISYSMMGAKIASEEKKPNGFFVIENEKALTELILKRSVRVICGIGSQTEKKLKEFGISTVEDLLKAPPQLIKTLGKAGEDMLRLARGMDDREVIAENISKSIGREYTFQQDVEDKEVLKDTLLLLSGDVGTRAKQKGLYGKTITLKIKFSDMSTITRSKSRDITNSAKKIHSYACELLDEVRILKPVRLVGVTLGNLTETKEEDGGQISLFEELDGTNVQEEKITALEDAVFVLSLKYGKNILKTGKELEVQQKYEKY